MAAALDVWLDVVRVASVARAAVPSVAADWRSDDVAESDERGAELALDVDVVRVFGTTDRAPAPALGLQADFCLDGFGRVTAAAGAWEEPDVESAGREDDAAEESCCDAQRTGVAARHSGTGSDPSFSLVLTSVDAVAGEACT